jgi:hypothetical protein
MRADRVSRVAVAAWAVLALLVECYYASVGWPGLRIVGPALLLLGVAAASFDRRAVAAVACAPYLFPALAFTLLGHYHVHYTTAWLAAMLGVVLPDAFRHPWHAPKRWAVALACWAGVVCVTAPLVVLRSADFRWDLLTRSRLPHEALGGLTMQSLGWIGHVALTLVIGILWFDWLCSLDEDFFKKWIIAPLAGTATVLAGVAIYQMTVDMSFLNATVYAGLGRATGTLFDANATGTLAAMWIGGWAIIAPDAKGRGRALLLLAVPFWLAVGATGSRTAFLMALVVTGFAAASLWRLVVARPGRRFAAAAAGGLLVVAVGIAAFSRLDSTAIGPIARIRNTAPALSREGLVSFAETMWDRDGYGGAATRMIARFPWFGVGVGAFHDMIREYDERIQPDNAQNWFRHQLAELGVVGSAGWIVFVLSFGWWVIRPHRGERAPAWAARGMLVALVLVSLIGMPGQDPAVAITFWTIAAWYLFLAGRPAPDRAPMHAAWTGALLVVLIAAAGTAQLAAGALRVPVRVRDSTSPRFTQYSYGVFPAETDDQGEFHWAGPRATVVVDASGGELQLTAGVNHADLQRRPVHAKAWVDGQLVIDDRLTVETPSVTRTVALRDRQRRVLIETWTDRAVVAPPPDGRALGLMLRWRFSTPPR